MSLTALKHTKMATVAVTVNTTTAILDNIYTAITAANDYAAVAVPSGFYPNGQPFGITLFSRAFTDAGLCRLGGEAQRAMVTTMGTTTLITTIST